MTSPDFDGQGPHDQAEAARRRLHRQPYLTLRNVSCSWQEGILHLNGCLPNYHLKQVASAAVKGLPGVRCVVNEIEVVAATRGHGSGA
jgi:hypothetical protein